ncbi:hypothetical protein EWE75_11195 [Sphingomonas populi]|uniref:Transposase n=1 Tax=Sphingomonas populi TaxID=2484750 RepID=A0A4Q6XVE6_9SPHN|nr:hypothetical protein [Sphingomonas populi]RZF64320.1 hypothetical protein EWE75_11195 [Sphingomonas populi]
MIPLPYQRVNDIVGCVLLDWGKKHKAFDSNALVAELNDRGAKVVISQHPGRAQKLRIDAAIYAWRHLIENFFCNLKEFSVSPCAAARPTGASKP